MDNKIFIFIVITIIIIILCLTRYSSNLKIKETFQGIEAISRPELTNITSLDELSNDYHYIGVGNKYISYRDGLVRLRPLDSNVVNYDKLFIIIRDTNNKYLFKHIYGFYLCLKFNDYTRDDSNINHSLITGNYELVGITHTTSKNNSNGITSFPNMEIQGTNAFKIWAYGPVFLKEISITGGDNKLTFVRNSGDASTFNFKHVKLNSGVDNRLQIIFKTMNGGNVVFNNHLLTMVRNNPDLMANILYLNGSNQGSREIEVEQQLSNLRIIINGGPQVRVSELAIKNYNVADNERQIVDVSEYSGGSSERLYFRIRSQAHGRRFYLNAGAYIYGETILKTTTDVRKASKFFFKKHSFYTTRQGTPHYVNLLHIINEGNEVPLSLSNPLYLSINNYENLKIYLLQYKLLRHAFELTSHNNGSYYGIKLTTIYHPGHARYNEKELYLRIGDDGIVGTQSYFANYEHLLIEPINSHGKDIVCGTGNIPEYKYTMSLIKNDEVAYLREFSTFEHSTYKCRYKFVTSNSYRNTIINSGAKYIRNLGVELSPELFRNNYVMFSGTNYTGKYIIIPTSGRKKYYSMFDLQNLARQSISWDGTINDRINSIKVPSGSTNGTGYQLYIYDHDNKNGEIKLVSNDISNLTSVGFSNKISSFEFDTQRDRVAKANGKFVFYSLANYLGMYFTIPTNESQREFNLSELNGLARASKTWENSTSINGNIMSIKFPNVDNGYQLYTYTENNKNGVMTLLARESGFASINHSISSVMFDTQIERRTGRENEFILFASNGYNGKYFRIPNNNPNKKEYILSEINSLAAASHTWGVSGGTNNSFEISSIKFPSNVQGEKVNILYLFDTDDYAGVGESLFVDYDGSNASIKSLRFEQYDDAESYDRRILVRSNMANGRPCPNICKTNNSTGNNYLTSRIGKINERTESGNSLRNTENICGGFLSDGECNDPNEENFNLTNLVRDSGQVNDCRGCQIPFKQSVNTNPRNNIFCPDKCFDSTKMHDGPSLLLYGAEGENSQSDGLCQDRVSLENNTCVYNNSYSDINMTSYDCSNCIENRNDPRFRSKIGEGFQNVDRYDENDVDVLAKIITTEGEGDRLFIRRKYISSLFDEYLYNMTSNVYNTRGRPFVKSIKNTTSDKLIGLYYDVLEMPLITKVTIQTEGNVPLNLNKIEVIDEDNVNIATADAVYIDGLDSSKLIGQNTGLYNIVYDTGNIRTVPEAKLVLNISLTHRKKLKNIKIITELRESFDNLLLVLYSGQTIVRVNKLSNSISSARGSIRFINISLENPSTQIDGQFQRESFPYNVGLFSDRTRRPNFILGPQDEIDLETGITNIRSRRVTDSDESNLGGYYGLIRTTNSANPIGTNVNGIIIEDIPKDCKYFNNNQTDCENLNVGIGNSALNAGNGVTVNRMENGNTCRYVEKSYLLPLESSSGFTYNAERESKNKFHPTIAELGLYGVHPGDSVYGNYSPSFGSAGDANEINGLCFSTTNTRAPTDGVCTRPGGNDDEKCINKVVDGTQYPRHAEANLVELGYINRMVSRESNLKSSEDALDVARSLDNIISTTNNEIEHRNRETRNQMRETKCKYCKRACAMIRHKTGKVELIKNCDCDNVESDCRDIEQFQNSNASNNNNDDEKIKRFESTYLNQSISVNDIGSKDLYTINMNNKCVSAYNDKDYKLIKCNNNNSQQFVKKQINNRYDAKYFTGKNATAQRDVEYPYNFLQSKTTGNCLQINDDGVSIEPCSPDNYKQHWSGYTDEKICINER